MFDQIFQFLQQNTPALAEVVAALGGKYGWLMTVLIYMATFRVFFKPVMSWLKAGVDITPSVKDNEFYDQITNSNVYKVASWLVDFLGSIKLPTSSSTEVSKPTT